MQLCTWTMMLNRCFKCLYTHTCNTKCFYQESFYFITGEAWLLNCSWQKRLPWRTVFLHCCISPHVHPGNRAPLSRCICRIGPTNQQTCESFRANDTTSCSVSIFHIVECLHQSVLLLSVLLQVLFGNRLLAVWTHAQEASAVHLV